MNILISSKTEVASDYIQDKGPSFSNPFFFHMIVRMSFLEYCATILHKNPSWLYVVFRLKSRRGSLTIKPCSTKPPLPLRLTSHTRGISHSVVPPSWNHTPLLQWSDVHACSLFTWLIPFPQQDSPPTCHLLQEALSDSLSLACSALWDDLVLLSVMAVNVMVIVFPTYDHPISKKDVFHLFPWCLLKIR